MQLFSLLTILFFSLGLAFSDSTTSWITRTRTVTNGDVVYTKTGTEIYTGQATTYPTSGTHTTTILVSNSLATYTKILTVTYGKVTQTTTHVTFTNNEGSYTKTFSTEMDLTNTQVVVTSGGSTFSSEVQTALAQTTGSTVNAAASASGSGSSSASSSSSSSSAGAAGMKTTGGFLGALAVVALLL